MSEPILIVRSPHGNLEALVVQNEQVAFFFLSIRDEDVEDTNFDFRGCWIRNFVVAPQELDFSALETGDIAMLPRKYCAHPAGAPRFLPEDLRVVWLEEGNGAALLERDEIIAILPPWGKLKEISGFARDCIEEHSLCWPLLPHNELRQRVQQAEEYWASWKARPWRAVQEAQLESYARQVGGYEKYYSIDRHKWPPKGMMQTSVAGGIALLTVGVCMRAQPQVEMSTDNPEKFRRIELAIGLSDELADTYFDKAASFLSDLASFPWLQYIWLGAGHTLPCDLFGSDSPFTSVLLVSEAPGRPPVEMKPFRGEPVTVLWALPITDAERDLAMEKGSAVLVARLRKLGVDYLARARRPAKGLLGQLFRSH